MDLSPPLHDDLGLDAGTLRGMSQSPLAPHVASPTELQARLQMSRLGSPFIVFRTPDGEQSLASLNGLDRLTIGRRPGSDIALPWDRRVSRIHTELERVGADWVASDDGLSTNGTWVGDTRLAGRRRLRDGDLIRVGNTVLAFCAPEEFSDATSFAADPATAARVSPAQRRVLVCLCRRYLETGALVPPTNGEIAAEVNLSVESVKSHLKAMFVAFDLNGLPASQKRVALVERAVRTAIVHERDVRGSRN
jgi:pSer/pThr/pTyr-binding forkhead associated (FHA) protein